MISIASIHFLRSVFANANRSWIALVLATMIFRIDIPVQSESLIFDYFVLSFIVSKVTTKEKIT